MQLTSKCALRKFLKLRRGIWSKNPRKYEFFLSHWSIVLCWNRNEIVSYEHAVMRNRMLQILLILIDLPTLCWVIYKLNKDDKERKSLLLNVQDNNRKYLFDDGADDKTEAKVIIGKSIECLQMAATFALKKKNCVKTLKNWKQHRKRCDGRTYGKMQTEPNARRSIY